MRMVSALRVSALALAAAGALGACNRDGEDATASPAVMAETRNISVEGDYAKEAVASSPAPPPGPGDGAGADAGVLLAYSYSMGVEAPKTAVPGLLQAHEQMCLAAGNALCQVLGSSVNSWGEDQISASLTLRAEPKWLAGFRGSIVSDAEKAGGRLTNNTVTAEDLTSFIIDVEARLSAKRALRDRIKVLLETNTGSLADLLAAERALAEVQGEIDSMTGQLEAARARVSLSSLSISYQSDPVTSTGVFKPLWEAFGDFGRTSVQSLAGAVRFVAGAWPFFIVLMIVLAIFRVWLRGRKRG